LIAKLAKLLDAVGHPVGTEGLATVEAGDLGGPLGAIRREVEDAFHFSGLLLCSIR